MIEKISISGNQPWDLNFIGRIMIIIERGTLSYSHKNMIYFDFSFSSCRTVVM